MPPTADGMETIIDIIKYAVRGDISHVLDNILLFEGNLACSLSSSVQFAN